MINEHLGGVECRSPLHSPPSLRRMARSGAPAPAQMRRGHPAPLPLRSAAGHFWCAAARRALAPLRPRARPAARAGPFASLRASRPAGPPLAGPWPAAFVPRRLARPIGPCRRPPLGRLLPPAPLAAALAAARAGSGRPVLALAASLALGLLRARCARPPRRCGLALPPGAARPARGPPSAAPLGLRFACPRGSRRGAARGASPRSFSAPVPPASGGWGSPPAGGVGACRRRSTKQCRYAPPRLRRAAYMRAATLPHLHHQPQSLSASAYSIVTSARS